MTDSQRLTGLVLLAHHKKFHFSKTDKVREAGFISTRKDGTERICFTAYYEAVLKLLQWEEMLNNRDDRGGADCIRSVIFHAEQKVPYKKGNDSVRINTDGNGQTLVSIYHHSEICRISYEICRISYNPCRPCVAVFDTKRSKSTKERLNRILMRFCGCQLYQQKGEWFVSHPMNGDKPFIDGINIPFVPTYREAFPEG